MTTPILDEPAVIALMRAEHTRLKAQSDELWLRLETIEAAKKPYQDAYDAALSEWSDVNRQTDMLELLLKAKEPAPVPQEVA